uniref:TNFR-Cys domain-containing protein n=1 Tax=Phasianus colchicus TaxID=9054 RepID=A0A669R7Q1_PHACC
MPGSGAEVCGEGEYLFEGICCVLCPAGTYVAQHCSTPHSRGRCASCTEGRDYTAHANGLEECLLCRQCKDDQITSRTCTVTNDAECQCKQGYFCPAEGCEICQKCSQMCPEGEEIVQICNATMDRGCGLPNQGLVHKLLNYCSVFKTTCILAWELFDRDRFPNKLKRQISYPFLAVKFYTGEKLQVYSGFLECQQ